MANENTVVKKPSTTIGVDKYTFFKVDQDTVTELTYGTGYTLPGTVQITPTDSGNSETFDADNNAYEVSTYIEKPGHDIENADIPPQVDAMWRGLKVDEVGGIAVNNKTEAPYFGVAWRTEHNNGSYRYFRTYKGKYSFASNVGGKTKPSSGSVDHQTAKATFTAVTPDNNDDMYYYIDDTDLTAEDKAEIATKWFEDMKYKPTAEQLKKEQSQTV